LTFLASADIQDSLEKKGLNFSRHASLRLAGWATVVTICLSLPVMFGLEVTMFSVTSAGGKVEL